MSETDQPEPEPVDIVIHHLGYLGGGYIGTIALLAGQSPRLPDGVVEVSGEPANADEIWNGERWAQPNRHYADASGIYVGEMEGGTQADGCVETRGAPADAADQLWNVDANQWQWKIHYYRDADGKFCGAYSGPDKPADLIEVPHAPGDGRQIWAGDDWASL